MVKIHQHSTNAGDLLPMVGGSSPQCSSEALPKVKASLGSFKEVHVNAGVNRYKGGLSAHFILGCLPTLLMKQFSVHMLNKAAEKQMVNHYEALTTHTQIVGFLWHRDYVFVCVSIISRLSGLRWLKQLLHHHEMIKLHFNQNISAEALHCNDARQTAMR